MKKYTGKTFWIHLKSDGTKAHDRIRYIGRKDIYNTKDGFFRWLCDMRESEGTENAIVINCGIVN